MAELVRICDLAGRPRGSGFVADDRGTVLTSHEAVDGLTRVVLHGPGERIWLAEAEDVTPLPGLALALVRTDGLGLAPLPVAMRDVIVPGTYVRISARGWRQARVLSADAEATYTATGRFHVLPAVVELAIGTDGRDALRLGGEACGGPVLDAGTGAVLAVLGTALLAERRSGGLAVPLRAAAAADPRGALAALLERNEASAPGYGEDLNLAGALELTGTTVGAALTPELPEPVPRPGIAAELAAFTAGDRHVLGLVGDPGTGRTTALAALASARARGTHPAPTLWLRGADLRAADASLADAAPAQPPMPRRGRGRHGGRTAPRPAQPDTDARVAGRAASGGARLLRETLLRAPDAAPHLPVLHALAEHVARTAHTARTARTSPDTFGGWFWNRLRLPEPDRLDLLRRLLPADHRYLDAAARRLVGAPRFVQPLLCAWFTDERRLRGRPGATLATAAQALLHTHRRLAVEDLTEVLVAAAPRRRAARRTRRGGTLRAVPGRGPLGPRRTARAPGRGRRVRPGHRPARPHPRRPGAPAPRRPDVARPHGSALGMLLRDPRVRARYLPDALVCFRDPECGSRPPAAALVAALPVLPDPDAVFDALRARADGEVLRALAALSNPALARRAGDLVRDHLADRPEDAAHAAAFVDRRLDHGPAAGPVVRPLVLDLLRSGPVAVRAAPAAVLAAPGGDPAHTLRGEPADVLLLEEADPRVLDALRVAGRPEARTRELLRCTGRRPGGLRAPDGGAGPYRPGLRRTVETLGRAAWDVT